jgi:hypothetical protein
MRVVACIRFVMSSMIAARNAPINLAEWPAHAA